MAVIGASWASGSWVGGPVWVEDSWATDSWVSGPVWEEDSWTDDAWKNNAWGTCGWGESGWVEDSWADRPSSGVRRLQQAKAEWKPAGRYFIDKRRKDDLMEIAAAIVQSGILD